MAKYIIDLGDDTDPTIARHSPILDPELGYWQLEGHFKLTPTKPEREPLKSEPNYSRQEVLEEKYKVSLSDPCCIVDANNKIWTYLDTSYDPNLKRQCSYWESQLYNHPIVFAPTPEIAEEIVQIRTGKWLPKKGDIRFMFDTKTGSTWDELRPALHNFISRDSQVIYYPSAEQRDKYAPKNSTEILEILKVRRDFDLQKVRDYRRMTTLPQEPQQEPLRTQTTPEANQRIATIRFDGSGGSISLEQLAEELRPLLFSNAQLIGKSMYDFVKAINPQQEGEING